MQKNENESPMEGEDHVRPHDDFLATQDFWVSRARDAYAKSTDFLETEHVKQWQKNRNNFESKHPAGSKFYSEAYRFRSKLFRPKIRAAESKGEAAYAEAMFGASEIVTVRPADEASKEGAVMAEIWQAIVNWRIQKDLKWYMTSVGAFQSTWIYGIAVGRQDWLYEDEEHEAARPGQLSRIERRVKVSKPRITVIDPMAFRFAPGSDWTDPVGTSPYIIEIVPMWLDDLMRFMSRPLVKGGQDAWIGVTREEVLAANRERSNSDAGKTEREKREEAQDKSKIDSFETIWVHRNIIQDESGVDHEFFTVGDSFLLSWPAPLDSPVGRNYVVGVSNIEVFKPIPASRVQLSEMIQAEANDLVNQQMDNVRLALNRGYIVQRDKDTDLSTLRRAYPGRITMTSDINSIREERVSDVTSSSYAQQDRLNNDMDDIVGGFSQGSVATNANLNRTVGGMQMLQNSSNAVTGYIVRTFVETWVEPVLGQILRLTQEYEEDSVIKKFAGERSLQMTDDLILKSMSVVVSVGFGNLDPKLRVQTLISSLQTAMAVAPRLAMRVDEDVVLAELTSVAGYRDGSRFLLSEEQMQQRQAQEQQVAQQAAQQGGGDAQAKLAIEQQRLQIQQSKIQNEADIARQRLELDRELGYAKIAAQENVTMQQLEQSLGIDLARADLAEREHNLKIAELMGRREDTKRDREEMMLKERMGSGI